MQIRRGILVLAVSCGLITAGCTFTPPTSPQSPSPTAPSPTAEVGAQSGFEIALGDLAASGPAGVAPEGTTARISLAENKVPANVEGVELASQPFDIAFEDGAQPALPVAVTWRIPAGDTHDTSTLAFLTINSDTGEWEGLPVSVIDDVAHVSIDHFSWGVFAWGGKVVDWVVDQVKKLIGLDFKAPSCNKKSVTLDGRTYNASVKPDGVFSCVESVDGKVGVSIYSNSPFVWRYRPTPADGQGRAPQITKDIDIAAMITMAAYDAMQGYKYTKETVLVPRGKATVLLNKGVTSSTAQARVDAGLGLITVLISGLDVGVAMVSGQKPSTWFDAGLLKLSGLSKLKGQGECLMDVARSIGEDGSNFGMDQVRATLGCFDSFSDVLKGFAKAAFSIVVSIVTSLVGLLVTQIQGLVGEFTGANLVTVKVKSSFAPITLSKDGIGPFKFGASRQKVSAYLTNVLGRPKTNPSQDGVGECEGGMGLWQSNETYGNLIVEYDGANESSKSPQHMAAWRLDSPQNLQPPLVLAKEVPLGLTMAQLKARYPNGGDFEYMDAWFAGGVWIFPKRGEFAETIFAGRLNWCT